MEITLAWFWLIKLIILLTVVFAIYKAYKNKFKNKFWNIFAIVLIILLIINPIKINGTNSVEVLKQQNYSIEQNKVLPKKVIDNSFENGSKKDTADITHDEIWN